VVLLQPTSGRRAGLPQQPHALSLCHCVTALGAGTTQLKIDQLRHRQLPPAAAIGYPHTLSAPLLHVPFRRTSFGKRSFSTAAPSVWNSLPVSVQNCDTLTLLKSRLKAHLFSSVYASVLNITVLFASASEATATWRFTNFVLYCTHGDTHGYGDRNPSHARQPCLTEHRTQSYGAGTK